MIRILAMLCLLAAPLTARADQPKADKPFIAPAGWNIDVHLLTMGPAEHAFTRFGHTGIMAVARKDGTKEYVSKVYNYGDADFNAFGFEWRFFRGTAQFRMSTIGSLNETVSLYAQQNRYITFQRLNLSREMNLKLIAVLENDLKPENR